MAKKKTRKKSPATRKAASHKARTQPAPSIDSLSTEEIQKHLRARERKVRSLERRRTKLLEQVAEIDNELVQHRGFATSSGGKRPRNEKNLGEAIHGVLKGKEMRVPEVVQAVIGSGYLTTATNFRTIVNQKLITDKRFKKVRRGVYTTK